MAIQPKNDTAIKVDTITEKTGSAGTTIEGVLLKDSYVQLDNNTGVKQKNSSGTVRTLMNLNASNEIAFDTNQDLDWNSYTPAPTGGSSMTWTTTSVDKAEYTQMGDMVSIVLKLVGTLSGTASNNVNIDIPVTAAHAMTVFSCLVIDAGSSSSPVAGIANLSSTTNIRVRRYDSANFTLAAGVQLWVAGFYRAA